MTTPDVLDDLNRMWPELADANGTTFNRHECAAIMLLASEEIHRLRAALHEIVDDAPISEPKPGLSFANDHQMVDSGWNSARWEMAEIARKALADE